MDMRIDTGATIKALETMRRQLPFATATGLNLLADQFQKVQQESVKRNFTLRQERFILNTVKRFRGVDFATKANLRATVRIDPTRDFLARHEVGGEKVAIQGKPYVAIPLPDLRRTKRGLVPRKMYPSAFKPFTDKGKVAVGAQNTLILPTKGGNRLLVQTRKRGPNKALYLFTPSVHIDPALHFQDNALATARSGWPSAFAQGWTRAMATAR
jgi:hypothetical protein